MHMNKILFVCTGNTCRSPMAEVLAKDYFKRNKLKLKAFSRGTSVMGSQRANEKAIKVMKDIYNLSLEDHVSKMISDKDVKKAEIILTMTRGHRDYLQNMYGDYKDKIFTLYEYIGDDEKDVADPFGQSEEVYALSAEDIYFAIERIFADYKREN